MAKKLFILHGTLQEVESKGYFELTARVAQLEALLRDSLKVSGDGAWHRRVYEALGEEKPPVRKLKGKVPRHQRELIERGELEG